MISIFLLTFLLLLTLFFPIISVFVNFISFILLKKERKFIAILLAISIASVAYVWTPNYQMDLYRWHLEMQMFRNFSFNDLIKYVIENYEPLNYLIKYILAKIGDFSLLQFFVSFIGYLEILFIFEDYAKRENIKLFPFFISLLFILTSLQFIGFISGLWFYFAIINFFVGVYLEFIVRTKKIHWLFYLVAICLHISVLLVFIILIISKFFKKKISLLSMFWIFIAFFSIDKIIVWLNTFDVSIFKYIYKLYTYYFLNGSQFDSINGGTNLIFGILRLAICFIIFLINRNVIIEKFGTKYFNFVAITIASISAIIFNANVFVRFVFFIQLLIFQILLIYINENNRREKIIIYMLLFLSIGVMSVRQYNSFISSNITKNIDDNILNPIFMLGGR